MVGFLQISVVSIIILSALYLASFYLIVKKDDLEKLSAYESGFTPLGNARMKISILYWIIGILYLIFDLEIIFIFPFASIIYSINSLFAIWSLMFFLIILTLAFIYEYLKGGLDLL
jgi:NADH-quinone oxidoreductase subunit A